MSDQYARFAQLRRAKATTTQVLKHGSSDSPANSDSHHATMDGAVSNNDSEEELGLELGPQTSKESSADPLHLLSCLPGGVEEISTFGSKESAALKFPPQKLQSANTTTARDFDPKPFKTLKDS